MYQSKKTDLVASWQSVHLHQLVLGVENQLCEGEQLRGKGAFWQVGERLERVPLLLQTLAHKTKKSK